MCAKAKVRHGIGRDNVEKNEEWGGGNRIKRTENNDKKHEKTPTNDKCRSTHPFCRNLRYFLLLNHRVPVQRCQHHLP